MTEGLGKGLPVPSGSGSPSTSEIREPKIKRSARAALLALAIGGAALFGSGAVAPQEAHAYAFGWSNNYRDLGGLNLDGYCRSRSNDGAELLQWNAGGWKCYDDVGWNFQIVNGQERFYHDISVDDACRWSTGNPKAFGVFKDWSNPNSIRCAQQLTLP